ncbi:MAG: phage terminase large subunit [Smithella sp.]
MIKSEWIKTYKELPYVNYYVWSWDTAIKKGQHNDYSVGQLWAVCHNGFYLVDQWRNKVEYASLKNMVKSLYAQTPSSEVLIEDKASGQQLIQDLKSDSTLPVIAMMPGKNMALDKISRVQIISPTFEAGKVYLPEGKPWLAEYIMELTNFPEVEHDDQCDATSQAIKRMIDRHKFEVEHATPETVKESIGEPSYMETDHGEDDGYW